MKVFAGYDSGGSKTMCVLTDEGGRLLGHGLGGPSNYLFCGEKAAADSIRTCTKAAFLNAGLPMQSLDTAYVASAAIRMRGGIAHEPFFRACLEADTVFCESDIVPIWHGAVRDKPAVILVAGTGAVTYLCRRDSFIKVGGWGPLIGDEGSGYDLGRRAMKTAVRIYDGREPYDDFVRAIFTLFDANKPSDLIRAVGGRDYRREIAAVAPVVFRLAEENNSVARRLLKDSADELALAVTTVVKRNENGETFPLVLGGSLLKPQEELYGLVVERVKRDCSGITRILSPKVHPAVAAAALALDHSGLGASGEALLKNAEGVLL